jgi:hypothetical protein
MLAHAISIRHRDPMLRSLNVPMGQDPWGGGDGEGEGKGIVLIMPR